jgi:predicted nucleic acid-binding protein
VNAPVPAFVLDANILIVLADVNHVHFPATDAAARHLLAIGAPLYTLPQSIFEFWVVATRPQSVNGLGLSVGSADMEVALIVASFPLLIDHAQYVSHWRNLMVKYQVTGKPAHDARYVASMLAHGLTHFLTLDAGFNRYTAEGIVAVDPLAVPTTFI